MHRYKRRQHLKIGILTRKLGETLAGIATISSCFSGLPCAAQISVQKQIRVIAYEGCLHAYGLPLNEYMKYVYDYQVSQGFSRDEDIIFENQDKIRKNKDFESVYNDEIASLTDKCFQTAKVLRPGVRRIDFEVVGRYDWEMRAISYLGWKFCLDKRKDITSSLKIKIMSSVPDNPSKEEIDMLVRHPEWKLVNRETIYGDDPRTCRAVNWLIEELNGKVK